MGVILKHKHCLRVRGYKSRHLQVSDKWFAQFDCLFSKTNSLRDCHMHVDCHKPN